MTREKFIEELNFNCKVDGKEVWLNIMPCLEKLLDEHEAQLKAKESDLERQDMIIKCLNIDLDNKEKLLKAKDEEIERLKSELKYYKELTNYLDNELRNTQYELSDLKDNT